MTKRARIETAVFIGLLVAGVASRILLSDLPNFAPVAAIALFAGYFFRSRGVALAIPISIMLVSDSFLGFYDFKMMLVVYGALAAPALVRNYLKRWMSLKDHPVVASAGLLTCSLGASLFFFVVTNFGSWIFFRTYEHTLSGLLACFTRAIPFFRYTLSGDLLFAFVLFGGYAVALYAVRSKQRDVAHAS